MKTLVLAIALAAMLDPSRAQGDADRAMRGGEVTFCQSPHEPLSEHALALCPHAASIPDCAAFEAACAKAAAKKSSAGWSGPSFGPPLFSVPGILGLIAQWIVWLIVAALVVAVAAVVVRSMVFGKRAAEPSEGREKKTKPDTAAIEIASNADEEALLRGAEDRARRGDYGAALQIYLAAALRSLDKRGAVRIAKDRTNGEYVRGCTDAAAKPALREIVREVDRVQFGGETASDEAVARAAQRAVAIVRALPAMALAAVLLGCGSAASIPAPPAGDDDPAGDTLLHQVLEGQGVALTDLDGALATMPLAKAGEDLPAVIVDAERTALDDDTRDHLAEWVEAGGVLVLAGRPWSWPKEFGAASSSSSGAHRITVDSHRGELAAGEALGFGSAVDRLATFDDGATYAAIETRGDGALIGIASDELLTNAGLARPGNAAALVAILSSADRLQFKLAQPDDGMSPPATPIAALSRAGLGLGMGHALAAVLVLFLAVGTRLSRPKPAPPPLRRAFAEHVRAVGALYARTRSAGHALAAYARFADERLRAHMPRGTTPNVDVVAFLSSRSRVPYHECQRIWARASAARSGAPPLGDELSVLKDLGSIYGAATAHAPGGAGSTPDR